MNQIMTFINIFLLKIISINNILIFFKALFIESHVTSILCSLYILFDNYDQYTVYYTVL